METKTAVNYNAQLLSGNALRNVADLDHSKIQGDKEKLNGLIAAYETMLDCVDVLFTYTPIPSDGCTTEEWRAFLNRLYFGVIKETSDYGTTSVTQGVAQYRFDNLLSKIELPKTMGFINCGSGGLKFQVCAVRALNKDTNIVHMLFECKGTGEEPSVNAMRMGSFVPKREIAPEEQTRRLNASLVQLRKELVARGLSSKIVLSAYVTGPARLHFEECQDKEEKESMEDEVEEFLQSHDFDEQEVWIVPWNQEGSFFMTQKQESEMELLAAQSLYGNLAKAGLIDEHVAVFETWATGRGSTQMNKFLAPVGMDIPGELKATVPRDFLKALQAGLAKDMYSKQKLFSKDAKLVIALKSGFAMLLDNKENQWIIESIRNQDVVLEGKNEEESNEGDEDEEESIFCATEQEANILMHVKRSRSADSGVDARATKMREKIAGLKSEISSIRGSIADAEARLANMETELDMLAVL